jgi:hypothetical protein
MQQIYLNNTKENIKNSIIFFNELPFNEACIRPTLFFLIFCPVNGECQNYHLHKNVI